MAIVLLTTARATKQRYCYALIETAWGYLALAGREGLLYRLLLPASDTRIVERAVKSEFPNAYRDDDLLSNLQGQLVDYFDGQVVQFDCKIDISWASDFGRQVLQGCAAIAVGNVLSYGGLARKIGRSGAARAVGQVMAANRVPLLIPCHRVVSANGSSGGYSGAGGVRFKRRLLAHESDMIAGMLAGS